MRKSLAERGGRGQRVNDVSHGAEAHYEQAFESAPTHDFPSRDCELMISVAE
jgi:hypothetical protein